MHAARRVHLTGATQLFIAQFETPLNRSGSAKIDCGWSRVSNRMHQREFASGLVSTSIKRPDWARKGCSHRRSGVVAIWNEISCTLQSGSTRRHQYTCI